VISVKPLDFVYFECDLYTSREKIIRSRTVLGTPRLRANAVTFNISLGELGHPDRAGTDEEMIRNEDDRDGGDG
jgi:hypothetical protein